MNDERQDGESKPTPIRVSFGLRLRTYFLTGVIVTAPISITIYLAWAFIDFVDEKVRLLVPLAYHPDRYLPFSVPGLGLILVVSGLVLVGFLTANFLGRSLIRMGEKIVSRMPVVRSIYSALKQLFETILAQSSNSFRQVVAVEFPRAGSWAIAFVTNEGGNEVARRLDKDMITVFVPTSPNPTSGYLMFVPRADVIFLDMTIEEGTKLIVSGGMVVPPDRGEVSQDTSPARQRGLLREG